MAITSISRIQHRRGKANSGYGLPQLASGELGWAIDTQELYIGNGSVAEGAPFVGNTRILTDKDIKSFTGNSGVSIFGKLNYKYKTNGSIVGVMIMNSGGTGYTDGTYNNVQLQWGPEFIGAEPISLPTATITVSQGSVVYVNIQNPGYGITIGAQFEVDAYSLGSGTGFYLYVSSVSGGGTSYERAVIRTVQDRLDDRVNTTDFGSVGDGYQDDTAALQDAINQLYLNIPGIQTLYGTIFQGDGSNTIILTANAIDEMVGGLINGPGIEPNTIILSVIAGISIVLSNPSTSTDTGTQIYTVKLQLDSIVAYANPKSRVILEIPPGTYRISDTLYIPSFATVVGAGLDSTIIKYEQSFSIIGAIQTDSNVLHTNSASDGMVGAAVYGDGIDPGTYVVSVDRDSSTSQSNDWVLTLSTTYTGTQEFVRNFTVILLEKDNIIQFVNDISVPGTPGAFEETLLNNQPRYITFKNISIQTQSTTQTVLKLNSVRDSLFENVMIEGAWVSSVAETSIGIGLYSNSTLVGSNNNVFKNIRISGFYYPVLANTDVFNNHFIDGVISSSYSGFMLGDSTDADAVGLGDGPTNTIIDCYNFTDIITQAVTLDIAKSNIVKNCVFKNVGFNEETSTYYPQVFSTARSNIFEKINSFRTSEFISANNVTPYTPEIAGHGIFHSYNEFVLDIEYHNTFVPLFRLPASSDKIGNPEGAIIHEIDYEYVSTENSYLRRGHITISVSVDNNIVQFVDDYDFIGNEDFNMYLDFDVNLLNSSNVIAGSVETPYTVQVVYKNILVGDVGKLAFSFKSTS